jgi:ABC-2 type transport system ATP-binding protein
MYNEKYLKINHLPIALLKSFSTFVVYYYTNTPKMIEIKHLNFGYSKQASLFHDLNITLTAGHIYGLLGKNGAGKSTLLKNIAGLVFPESGQCMINGIATSRRSVTVLEDLYYIAEEIFVPALTSTQFAKSTADFYPKFSIADFYAYLKILDVDPQASLTKMSYGQQKKAIIAFGLATNTNVLIMDEPTNGLDIPSKIQFRKLIASVLNDERCIIISTHQVRDLDSLIDTILILDNHQIVVNSSVDELVEKLVFGLYPETTGLSVLYEEESIRGKHAILKNNSEKMSRMDLELLFNGVTTGSQELINELKASSKYE